MDPVTLGMAKSYAKKGYLPLGDSPGVWQADRWVDTVLDPPLTVDLPVLSYASTAQIPSAVVISQLRKPPFTSNEDGDIAGDTHFRISGTPALVPVPSDKNFLQTPTKPGGVSQSSRWTARYEFDTNAPEVEFWTRAGSPDPQMLFSVNGRLATKTTFPTTQTSGGHVYIKLAFPAAGPRRIGAWNFGNDGLRSVRLTAGHTATRPAGAFKKTIVFLGDSYTAGSGTYSLGTGANGLETFALQVGLLLGGDNIVLAGIGGTGWTSTGVPDATGYPSDYAARLPVVLGFCTPDVVVCLGSINDSYLNPSAITAGVGAALSQLTAVPEVYVVGTVGSGTTNDVINNAVKAGTLAAGRHFVNLFGMIYGTGKVGSPNGTGNSDFYILPDGLHPSYLGHREIARRVYKGIIGR